MCGFTLLYVRLTSWLVVCESANVYASFVVIVIYNLHGLDRRAVVGRLFIVLVEIKIKFEVIVFASYYSR